MRGRAGWRLAALALGCALPAAALADLAAAEAAWRGRDFRAAREHLEAAAAEGDRRAEARLGDLYRLGLGVPADPRRSTAWYRRAARQGDPQAQYWLAVHYRDGVGVAPEASQANRWFRAAASAGHVLAQLNLGLRYLDGAGDLPRDAVLAYAWLARAARGGNRLAESHRQRVGATLSASERSQAEALSRARVR